jgi:hypothetical protein
VRIALNLSSIWPQIGMQIISNINGKTAIAAAAVG